MAAEERPAPDSPGAGQMALDLGQADEQVGYRGPTVCKIVGITYRQLDYWARTDLVTPSLQEAKGSGTQRLYAFEDIVQLRVVKRLVDTGVSLKRVRVALDELRAGGRSLSEVTLVADGTSIYAVDDEQRVVDLLRRGQGVFAIAVGPVIEELRGEVTAFPTETPDRRRPSAGGAVADTGS